MENLGLIINSEASTVMVDGFIVKVEIDLEVRIREAIELLFKFVRMREEANFERCLLVVISKMETLLYVFWSDVTLAPSGTFQPLSANLL